MMRTSTGFYEAVSFPFSDKEINYEAVLEPDGINLLQANGKGAAQSVRPCVFSNVCWGEIHSGKTIACLHNPDLAREGEARRKAFDETMTLIAGLDEAHLALRTDASLAGNLSQNIFMRAEKKRSLMEPANMVTSESRMVRLKTST